MDNKGKLYQISDNTSELATLISYTLLSVILSGETVLLSWETWVIPLLYAGIVGSWTFYLVRMFETRMRLWIDAILMMFAMFFYGIHLTSVYDLAPVLGVVMMIFAIADIPGLIYMAMINYYAIMLFDLIQILNMHVKFDALGVTRTLLHLLLVFMFGVLALNFLKRNKRERELYNEIIGDLEETNRRTEDFLTNISHEFRTPINAVTGITSVLVNKVKDKDVLNDVMSIQTAGYRLMEQVGDILDYTEVDTGHFTLSEDVYMITSLVNDMVTERRLSADVDDKELIVNVDPNIPAQLYGDGSAIKKIIRNLIDNSEKFTRDGGIYVHIYTLPKSYGVNLVIEVEDTGIGIDSSELKRIKERFYQVNSSRTRRVGGLGLGLSVVCGLTRLMSGFVKIESVKDQGTKVLVSLPQKVADATPSVMLDDKTELCIAYFADMEKYSNPKVRDFYRHTLHSMVKGFGVKLYNVTSYADLEDLMNKYNLTHLFVGVDEYLDYFKEINALSDKLNIIRFTRENIISEANSNITSITLPFYSYSIAKALSAVTYDDEVLYTHMTCPNVRVLVVDDEPMNLMVAKGIFRDYGMTVDTALSGMEAIDMCDDEDYDIIFMDHMMPDMDGVETLKRLRILETRISKKFTVVALTANAISGAREMFMSEGFDGFVAKPIDKIELERVIKKVLASDKIVYDSVDSEDDTLEAENVTDTKEVDKDEPKDWIEVLNEAGINTETGVMYCGGSKDFYVSILKKYIEESEEKIASSNRYLKNEDFDNYRIVVHAIKSTSKMIGVDDMFDEALKLETAVKESDYEYIKNNHDTMIEHYKLKVKLISEAL